jgi:hypothetical protein
VSAHKGERERLTFRVPVEVAQKLRVMADALGVDLNSLVNLILRDFSEGRL